MLDDDEGALFLLRPLSELQHNLDEAFYKSLPTYFHYQKRQILSYIYFISSQAPCLYDALQARNSSLSRIFTENVKKDKFLNFVEELSESLEKLVRSDKAVCMVQTFYKTLKSHMKSLEHNSLAAEVYLMFLRARKVLLNINIEKVFEHLNDIHFTLEVSFWKVQTGQWPEMAKFVDNFFRLTVGSREFWNRLGTLLH